MPAAGPIARPPVISDYNIEFSYSIITAECQDLLNKAAARWSELVVGDFTDCFVSYLPFREFSGRWLVSANCLIPKPRKMKASKVGGYRKIMCIDWDGTCLGDELTTPSVGLLLSCILVGGLEDIDYNVTYLTVDTFGQVDISCPPCTTF